MHVILIAVGWLDTNDYIVSLTTWPCNSTSICNIYRLDTATEEGFRYVEHHDAKIWVFKNAGFCKSGHIYVLLCHMLHITVFTDHDLNWKMPI